ncbi:hypothetical protein ABT034_34655 [Streptomyces sp. NPDC002773]|uniref:hypothetical protein n=1 Tax=Streptomyces sp. NPDC002773 TaxID=3154430 RepID=UPI003318A1D2
MTLPHSQAARVQLVRCVVAKFAPVIGAGLSSEWDDVVLDHPGLPEITEGLAGMADPGVAVSLDDVEELTDSLEELLDLFEDEPMGSAYYPFKAAELVELYCRMATGDLPDDAPVPLAEWVDRFAGHVDWQLDKSGIDLGRPKYFAELELELRSGQAGLTGHEDSNFREFMESSRDIGSRYVSALRSALS